MKKCNHNLAKGLGVAVLLMGSSLALAETVNVPATVTVNNAIDFTFTGSLNFGEVRATADATDLTCVGLTLAANPATPIGSQVTPAACSAGAGTAVMQAVGGTPERPVFTIAGVAPFTTMNLTVPTTNIDLTAATGPGTPQFFLSAFTAYKTSATAGAITITAGAGTIAVDATGGATFTVGATLGTHLGAGVSTAYQDLAYAGAFDVVVTY